MELAGVLAASDIVRSKIDGEFNENKTKTENLASAEAKLSALKSKAREIDLMDYKNVKLIYEEAVNIKNSLSAEFSEVMKPLLSSL